MCNNSSAAADMEIRSDNNESGQLFRIRKNNDGTYTFLTKSSSYRRVVAVKDGSYSDGIKIIQDLDVGSNGQKFELIRSEADCPTVVVPCVYGTAPGYSSLGVKSHPVYLERFFNKYTDLLSNVTWYIYENGVITYNDTEKTICGTATGLAWMEAYEDGKLVLVCYISVENILSSFAPSVRDYLYADGTFLGTLSLDTYEIERTVDPLVMRTEWYLYAVKLMRDGKTDEQIRNALNEKFALNTTNDYAWRVLCAEIDLGARGGYARERLIPSFDGAFFLLDFIWVQYAVYSLATLDTVNTYIPFTEQDIFDIEADAKKSIEKEHFDSCTQKIDNDIDDLSYTNRTVLTAKERNKVLIREGLTNPIPYQAKTPVLKIQLTEDTQFVRVFAEGHSNRMGKWIMRYSDIQGLTPAEIQMKFALNYEPLEFCYVTVPAGTSIYVGFVNQSSAYGTLQYEIIGLIPGSSFGNGIPFS